jgi:succinate dehydrogenase / fumarate reductase iron-sulfur subunit
MIVKIQRFDEMISDKPYVETYNVPIEKNNRFTVLDLLRYIEENIDNTLSYYNHSTCNHGICGRCLLKVDGKNVLACTHLVQNDEIEIFPKNDKLIKDLITK